MKALQTIGLLIGLCFVITSAQTAFAAKINKGEDGVALKGYDAVAYFTDKSAVVGSKEFQHKWMDAIWYFKNADHKDMFIKDPKKYAPQYGGYCAYAVSRGSTADADPRSWAVVNGKLYLNINANVQIFWNRNRVANILKANVNWPRLSGGK